MTNHDYDSYSIDNDMWYKKRKHIFYLFGNIGNKGYAVASYSTKTKRLIIKCANDHIPPNHILKEFVEKAEKRGQNNDQ